MGDVPSPNGMLKHDAPFDGAKFYQPQMG